MLFEASNSCATLALSWTAATPRQWDIKISQVKIFCQRFILASSERGLFVWQFVCLLQSWRHFAQMAFFAPLPDGLYINLWRLPLLQQNTSSHKFWFHFFLGRYRFQLLIASHWFWDIFTQDASSKAGIPTGKRQSLLVLSRNTLAQIFFFQSRPLHTTISLESYKCHHSESKVLLYSQFYSRPSGHKWRINLFSDISLSYFTDDWIGSVFVLG